MSTETQPKFQTARKDHWCDVCDRKIPAGTRYWRTYEEGAYGSVVKDEKSHTNCLDYESQPHRDEKLA